MAQAEISENFDVNIDSLYKVITDYTKYPEFVDACTKSDIAHRDGNKVTVDYGLSLIKDISYSLEHTESPENHSMSWSLLKSEFLKKNVGHWKLQKVSEKETKVDYSIDIEFKIPVPGLILKKLVKGSLPKMMKNFKERARTHG